MNLNRLGCSYGREKLSDISKEHTFLGERLLSVFFPSRQFSPSAGSLVPNSVTTIYGFSLIRHEFSLTTVTKLLRQRHGI